MKMLHILIYILIISTQVASDDDKFAICNCSHHGTEQHKNATLIYDPKSCACTCKKNVIGTQCTECKDGYYGLKETDGCRECECDRNGSLSILCDKQTGKCHCKAGFVGYRCNVCQQEFFRSSRISSDCQKCNCVDKFSKSLQCDNNGKCLCITGIKGKRCNEFENIVHGTEQFCIDHNACYEIILDKIEKLKKDFEKLENIEIKNISSELPDSHGMLKLFITELKTNIKDLIDYKSLEDLENKFISVQRKIHATRKKYEKDTELEKSAINMKDIEDLLNKIAELQNHKKLFNETIIEIEGIAELSSKTEKNISDITQILDEQANKINRTWLNIDIFFKNMTETDKLKQLRSDIEATDVEKFKERIEKITNDTTYSNATNINMQKLISKLKIPRVPHFNKQDYNKIKMKENRLTDRINTIISLKNEMEMAKLNITNATIKAINKFLIVAAEDINDTISDTVKFSKKATEEIRTIEKSIRENEENLKNIQNDVNNLENQRDRIIGEIEKLQGWIQQHMGDGHLEIDFLQAIKDLQYRVREETEYYGQKLEDIKNFEMLIEKDYMIIQKVIEDIISCLKNQTIDIEHDIELADTELSKRENDLILIELIIAVTEAKNEVVTMQKLQRYLSETIADNKTICEDFELTR